MMKPQKLTAIFLSAILIAVLGQTLTKAETFEAGISPGDSFSYTFKVYWKAPSPDLIAPTNIVELNNTEWVKITVHEAQGPLVVMNVTTHFKNGTENKAQIWVNLLSGEGNGFGYIIAPNLGARRMAYHMGIEKGYSFPLKEELVKSYPFGERRILHATVNKTGSEEYVLISHDMYFDKETGVMLEWIITQIPKNVPATISLVWKIVDFHITSEKTTNENPYNKILTITIIATVASLSTAILFHRRGKRGRVDRKLSNKTLKPKTSKSYIQFRRYLCGGLKS